MKPLKIGEVAKETGVSVKAIRFDEKIGIPGPDFFIRVYHRYWFFPRISWGGFSDATSGLLSPACVWHIFVSWVLWMDAGRENLQAQSTAVWNG